jgi:hypothetical protein
MNLMTRRGRAGVIGRKLSVSERRALVEYLKTF